MNHGQYKEQDEDQGDLVYPSSEEQLRAWQAAKEDAEACWLGEIDEELMVTLVKQIEDVIKQPGAPYSPTYEEKYLRIRGLVEDLREAYAQREADGGWRLYLGMGE
jgi:hypothetical protein